jgi:Putative auto-transporter adhesin, head GIN domain
MRKINALFLLLVLFSACNYMGGRLMRGNGNPGTQTRNVGSFNSIHALGSMDVIVVPGQDYSVRVESDENLLPYILTDKEGDALMIHTRNHYNLQPRTGMKIYVTTPNVEGLEVSGSGSLVSNGKLHANGRLKIEVTGSGDVKVDIDAPEIAAESTGSGNVILSGTTRNFSSEINGSGEVHCFNLLSESTKVEINGSGAAEIYASKQLDVEINGSGDVAYKGTPAINQRIAGSGTVKSAP